jgi:hypothetical protein
MMALRSAVRAGLKVPGSTVDKLKQFLKNSQSTSGGFHYSLPRGGESLGCTAAGLFASIMWECCDDKVIDKGLKYCDQWNDTLPDRNRTRDFEYIYYWYYRTMVSFQVQGREWKRWNGIIRPYLVSRQSKEGHELGSWSIIDYNNCGRVYSTALAVICLEVYYRYMPIYRTETNGLIVDATDDSVEETPEEKRIARDLEKSKLTEEDRAKLEAAEREELLKDSYKRLESANSFDRYLGVRRLSELGAKEAAPKMMKAADGENGNIKAVMIVYIGRVKSDDTIPWLMRLLDDEDEKIRAAAMNALMNATGIYITEVERWKKWYKDRLDKASRK